MDIVERYLQSVGFWLPKAQKKDIVAELSEDIRSEMEERESRLGRALNDVEVAGILRQRGRPIVVANRYMPQRHVIGPVLYPAYAFVLKVVCLCYLCPWVLVWVCLVAFDARYRAERLAWNLTILGDWATFWHIAFFLFGAITATFAVMERVQATSRFLDNWDPLALPAVAATRRKTSPRVQALGEAIFSVIFIAIWLSWREAYFDALLPVAGIFRLAPEWQRLYWPVVALSSAGLAQQIGSLVRPQWTWLRPSAQFVINVTGVGLLLSVIGAGPLVVLLNPAANQVRYGHAVAVLNQVAFWSLLGMAIGLGIACLVHGYQCLKLIRGESR
jgi:hypothetical protein